MQIIDSSPWGVRSSVFRLKPRAGTEPNFLLFPMIHIGEPSYYEEVSKRLGACDIILYEGVKSPTVRRLTRSYRWAVANPRLGLVLQHSMKLDHLNGRIFHADVSGPAFENRWKEVARWVRGLVFFIAPTIGLHRRWFGTRRAIARHLGKEVYEAARSTPASKDLSKFTEVVLDWRDRHLIAVLDQHRQMYRTPDACIGVAYGASHMSAVIRHLVRMCGYRVEATEWITVFEL